MMVSKLEAAIQNMCLDNGAHFSTFDTGTYQSFFCDTTYRQAEVRLVFCSYTRKIKGMRQTQYGVCVEPRALDTMIAIIDVKSRVETDEGMAIHHLQKLFDFCKKGEVDPSLLPNSYGVWSELTKESKSVVAAVACKEQKSIRFEYGIELNANLIHNKNEPDTFQLVYTDCYTTEMMCLEEGKIIEQRKIPSHLFIEVHQLDEQEKNNLHDTHCENIFELGKHISKLYGYKTHLGRIFD